RSAARAFGPREAVARARCVVAEAEIALASRDLGWPAKALDAARATLEEHDDAANAAHARYLETRRLLLIGRVDEAERKLAALEPAPFPPAAKTAHELVVAGIAMRRLHAKTARAALARAEDAARRAGIPALIAEVESASLVLNAPAARLLASRSRAAAHRASAACGRERDEAVVCPCPALRTRVRRARAGHRRRACCRARLSRRR